MKTFFALSLILASLHSYASGVSEEIIEECKVPASEKLQDKADGFKATIDEATISKLDEEKKILHGSVFVWFKAEAYTERGDKIFVTTITEKPVLPLKKPCF